VLKKFKMLGAACAFSLFFSLLPLAGRVSAGEKIAAVNLIAVGEYGGQILEDAAGGRCGLARFAAAIKAEKKKGGMLFVSTGNMLGGTPESELTGGFPLISAFNDLRLDVMGIGAEDLNWPPKTLAQQAAAARYPYVGLAEILDEQSQNHSVPYKIVKRGGIKLGFLAVHKKHFNGGVLSADAVLADAEKLQSYITELQNEETDVVALITDIQSPDILQAILENLTGIDLVVADTDAFLNGQPLGGAVLVSAGKHGSAYAKAAIRYDVKAAKLLSVACSYETIPATTEPDVSYRAFTERVQAKVSFLKQQPLGESEAELWHNPNGVSVAGQWITDTVRQGTDADVAFLYGGDVAGGLRKGVISKGDLYRVLPRNDEVVVALMTGQAVQRFVGEGLENGARGILLFSGLQAVYDDNKVSGRKTAVKLTDGDELVMEKLYRVAIAERDYLTHKESFYGNTVEYTGRLWRDYLFDAVQDKTITAADDGRLVILARRGTEDIVYE